VKYLCLVYHAGDAVSGLPERAYEAMVGEVRAYRDELEAGGHHLASSSLEPVTAATTIRVRNGMLSITDGPFAETKEHLGGFYLIEARDLNEAIRLAARMPPARLGSIEIRPVRECGGRGGLPVVTTGADCPGDEGAGA
jgi:hypothetical protein